MMTHQGQNIQKKKMFLQVFLFCLGNYSVVVSKNLLLSVDISQVLKQDFFQQTLPQLLLLLRKKSQNSTLLFFFAGETKGLLLIREKETIFRDDNFKGHRGENKSFLESQKKFCRRK
jgi:hypothetical protein